MPYSRDKQEHTVRISKTGSDSNEIRKYHNGMMRTWLEQNVEGEWALDIYTKYDIENSGASVVSVTHFDYSFSDLGDATLFRLRF